MTHSDQTEKALLNQDGSCRDINFSEEISSAGAIGVLNFISTNWTLFDAVDSNGDEYNLEKARILLLESSGSLRTIWKGSENPNQLQIYFHWVESNKIFCELTFFPQDLNLETFSLTSFLEFIAKLVHAADSQEYYVRYENGAWRHGKPNLDQSVIFSHNDLSLLIVSPMKR